MSVTNPQSSAPQRTPTFVDLLRELFRFSRPSVPAAQFYPAFLKSLTIALRAPNACVWCATGEAFQVLADDGHLVAALLLPGP